MGEEEPFFVIRAGAVWACWLSGKPAVKLGDEAGVLAAMKEFLAGTGPGVAAAAPEPTPPAPRPTPAAQRPVAPPPAAPPPAPPAPPRAAVERVEQRHDISIVGRVRSGTAARDVTIQDLSERGCRFHDTFGQLRIGTRITIKLGPIGPIPATVRWCREEDRGVEFDTPLYPSVLEHIRQHFDLRR